MSAAVAGLIIASIGALVIAIAFVVGKVHRSRWELSKGQQAVRYLAAFIAALGVWIVIGARSAPQSEELPCVGIEEALAAGVERGVPVVIDFTADWCTACHELREKTLNSAAVRAEQENFVCGVVDVTEVTEENSALQEAYGVQSLPRLAMVNSAGEYVPATSLNGFVDIDTFLQALSDTETATPGAAPQESKFSKSLQEKGWLLTFLLIFVTGIGASFTPCVYPIIPITVAVFGAKEAQSTAEAFLLSLVFVFGMAVTYTVLGVSAALAGGLFGAALQSFWLILAFAVLFVGLGLSMLGLFEMRLPTGLQTRLASAGRTGFAGAFAMGLACGIIAAPCVGPILSGALLYIAERQDPLLGSALMATFAFGMGLLFLVLGTFSSLIHRLPSSGAWMEVVKAVFAIGLFTAAIFYLSRHLSFLTELQRVLWQLLGFG